jgi:peptide/nickel transport system substrate-binding protein
MFLHIPDTSTRISALRTGKIDYMRNISWDQAMGLDQTNPDMVKSGLHGGGAGIPLHTNNEPTSNINVRHALNMAVNKDEIISDYYQGYAVSPLGNFPYHSGWGEYSLQVEDIPDEIKDIYGYDPAGAMALLDAAGYTADPVTGERMVLEAECIIQDSDFAALIAGYLEDIGVTLDIIVLERGAYESHKYASNYNHVFMWGTTGIGIDVNQLQPLTMYFGTGRINIPDWGTGEAGKSGELFPAMLEDTVQTQDDAARMAKYMDIGLYILEEAPYLLVPARMNYTYWQPWVKGYKPKAGSYIPMMDHNMFKFWWLDLDVKESYTGER